MIGYAREAAIANELSWQKISPEAWKESDRHAVSEFELTGVCSIYEKEFLHRSGSPVPVLVAAALFPGSPSEGIAFAIDLTERRVKERFEQEFLAGVAHDLKNPLAAVKAQAQLMRRRLQSGKLTEQIANDGLLSVDINVTRVVRRIEELMDVALMRAGHHLDLVLGSVDLIELTNQRAEAYRQTTERHKIIVETVEERLIGVWDGIRVERVIDNLLSNAIKFSPNGGDIRIQLDRDRTKTGDWAILSITDHGVGVPPTDLPFVFDHTRGGSNVRGRLEGVGIRLAAARFLVEQHQGTITLERTLGEGSTFTLRLPLTPADPKSGLPSAKGTVSSLAN